MSYLVMFVSSAILSLILTPHVIKLAYKLNAIDVPKDSRRVHKRPIPRMGGLAVFISFCIVSIFSLKLDLTLVGLLLSSLIIVFMGMVDDIKTLRPVSKLIIQLFASILLILFGIKIKSLSIPFMGVDKYINLGFFSVPLTIFWVVGMTNAFNLIDGLDGLASGIGFISSITLFIISILTSRYLSSVLTIILAGSCLGFLYYNFNPAKVFLGDTGSQFIGFILASISIISAIKYYTAFSILASVLAFGVPIYDTLSAIIRRKLNNRPIMEADRGHLHHRLLDKGFSHKNVVIIIYLISMVLGIISIFTIVLPSSISVFLFISAATLLVFWKVLNKNYRDQLYNK
ncbi:UDP-GlcNAc:undecaprenyl-phosphate GlcNAc-1-phosphate transferase [Caloramator fervidus]|uniref:UDP-GlcNAc:undecaprenyl-phosphate GlcNAc-1-phosphate transferase n=1 Tax=Caloramator fervidus TaxID=29344 RepID=A0A1H5T0R4_9CLOT|nr:MraY family glycosyltransferase [Caloramator fervidus]SEF55691.1 UDP-GlcNAc:undecaprenyl-phosphate GlcNAc-1-phosphate transferase [Caloramator fervidus]